MKPRRRIKQRILLGVLIMLVLCSSLWRQPEPAASHSMAAPPPKHKYVIMLTVTNDSSLKETMGREFYAEVRKFSKTAVFNVLLSPKPWEDKDTCKNDIACDRITINTEKRRLLFICNRTPYDEQPGPPCKASTEALFREKCIDTLPQELPKQLWNHSKAFHSGEDQ